ncbi:MAG: PhzF family phenazine biosynthesis protein [Sphingobium sp.]|nr:PhzF family phenazine biosynthesis protein [Sphingobium sp.]
MQLDFVQVDAFADGPFTGNPAAVMPLESWLADDVLQGIAMENNLSETAFIVPDASGESDFELRWFTPESEVRLCGHATLASGHVILSRQPGQSQVRFSTRQAGVLTVSRSDKGYDVALPAWGPTPKPLPEALAGLGVDSAVETLWRDGGYGVVVLASEEEVRGLRPDMRKLAALGDRQTIVTAPGQGTDIVSRVFVPGAGVDEDPVTGSAHAVIVPYWTARLGKPQITAFQASKRGGHLFCRVEGDTVVLTGTCRTVIEGQFSL